MTSPAPTRSSGIPLVSPGRWERIRAAGPLAFMLSYGVVGIGVPAALALNWATITLRGDALPFLSPLNAIELTLTLLLFAPAVGGLAGVLLWRRAERMLGFVDAMPAEVSAGQAAQTTSQVDAEAKALAKLRERLAGLARTSPEALSSQAIMMALLGYAYVLTIVILVVGGIVLLLQIPNRGTMQMAIWLGLFGFFLLSALWIRVSPPDGLLVTRAGSPRLFDVLEDIRRRIDAPAPDVVLINAELNASVIELPRYGIFGLPKRYLTVGLPLLEAMPADECAAILAHEMAHLSRRHSRGLLWVGRVELTWHVVAMSLQGGRHWGRMLMLPFFKWYVPRLQAYAHATSRMHEFEADALAAECTDPDVTIRALVRLHALGRLLTTRILPSIHRESATNAEPPHDGIDRMTHALYELRSQSDMRRLTERVLADRTLDADTHPSLVQRVEQLAKGRDTAPGTDALVEAMLAPSTSGAEELLGARRLPKVRERIGTTWQVQVMDAWRGWHALARAGRVVSAKGDADEDAEFAALVARARWSAACDTRESAVVLAREAHTRRPPGVETLVILGQLLIDGDVEDERIEGVSLLEDAQSHDSGLALDACKALEAHYARGGMAADVDRIRSRMRLIEDAKLATLAERHSLTVNDAMAPHGLSTASIDGIRKACQSVPAVGRAFLVRKRTAFLREQPALILAIELELKWYKPALSGAQTEATAAVLDRIQLTEPVDLMVFAIHRGDGLRARMESIPGALVYRRES